MAKTRAGRHRPPHTARKAGPIVGAVVLCVAAGGTAWGLSHNGDSSGSTHPTVSAGTPAAAQTRTTTAAASPATTASSTDTSALRALSACRSTIGTGQKMVAAADRNYADWSAHVYAQLDFDHRKITFAQGEAIWKRTKLAGPADLKAYDTAKRAWDKADQNACDSLPTAAPASEVTMCHARFTALKKVITAAAPVYGGWKGHQIQMTHTQEKSDDPNAYFKEWFGRVRNAEKPLAAYKSAKDAYDRTASCPAA